MTQPTDCATTFEPTPEHRARHVAWVDEMVATEDAEDYLVRRALIAEMLT